MSAVASESRAATSQCPPASETTRKVSSVVLESTPLVEVPANSERYVEVPTYEEEIKYVTVREVKEIEKLVPKYEIEYVDKIVEVPRIEYIDKIVEVPKIQEKIVEVKVPRIEDRIVEKIVEKKVVRTRPVERVVEVPGPVVEVPKPFTTERQVIVERPVEHHVPVIVAQTVKPIISQSASHVDVDVRDFEPTVIPVDVHVARPIHSVLEAKGHVSTAHKLVNVTSAQYNTMLRLLNSHMDAAHKASLPYVQENGSVPFVADSDAQYIVAPPSIEIEGYVRPGNKSGVPNITGSTTSEVRLMRGADPLATTVVTSTKRSPLNCCNVPIGGRTRTTVETTTLGSEVSPRVLENHTEALTVASRVGGDRSATSTSSSSVVPSQSHHTTSSSHPSSRQASNRVDTIASLRSERLNPRTRVCC